MTISIEFEEYFWFWTTKLWNAPNSLVSIFLLVTMENWSSPAVLNFVPDQNFFVTWSKSNSPGLLGAASAHVHVLTFFVMSFGTCKWPIITWLLFSVLSELYKNIWCCHTRQRTSTWGCFIVIMMLFLLAEVWELRPLQGAEKVSFTACHLGKL